MPTKKTDAGRKYEVTGASDSFTVAPNTRIYAATRLTGVEPGTVNVVWLIV